MLLKGHVSRRLLASSSLVAGLMISFITASPCAAAPGNGRAWELVTSRDPVASIVFQPLAISAQGDRYAYFTVGSGPGAPAGDLAATNLATREASGWSTTPLGAPYSLSKIALFPSTPSAFSADLGEAVWLSSVPLSPGAPSEGEYGIYRLSADGSVAFLFDAGSEQPELIRASADTGRMVLTTASHLLPDDEARINGQSVYSWSNGTLSLIDVDDGGHLLSPCGSAVSADYGVTHSAERIFFTTQLPGEPDEWGNPCTGPRKVFMHDTNGATMDISASECTRTDCNADQSVSFVGATPSGSDAFLVTSQQLTNADQDEAPDLYRYNVAGHDLELLSSSSAGSDAGVLSDDFAFSEDGSTVYFFSSGKLIPGLGSDNEPNLYLADNAGLHFLATLPQEVPLQSSRDGAALVLATAAPLEEGDTDGYNDVYLYRVDSGEFVRLSKGAAGAGNGPHDATLPSSSSLGSAFPSPPFNDISSDGHRVFFSTEEQLTPDDYNQAPDIYEWARGATELVSSGTGAGGATFAGAMPDGTTVFFNTAESLLPADNDGGEHDIYAARIGGGFDEEVEAPPGGDCSAGECESSPTKTRPGIRSLESHPGGRKGRLHMFSLPPSAGRRVVKTGTVAATIFSTEPGIVHIRGEVEVGGKERTVADGTAGAIRAGKVRVKLQFAAFLRRRLRHETAVTVRFTLRQRRLRTERSMRLLWGGHCCA